MIKLAKEIHLGPTTTICIVSSEAHHIDFTFIWLRWYNCRRKPGKTFGHQNTRITSLLPFTLLLALCCEQAQAQITSIFNTKFMNLSAY